MSWTLVARKRGWVPDWLWRLLAPIAPHQPFRRWLTEPVPYERDGAMWIDA
ncbi:MAG TPA: hypothetical protein VFW92_06830 [Candidatus Limnocylindrales bacterium]|nr:hypothetical protein [Candidatus Limnocylindrales bacterium]